jgi:hypothetical protein
MLAFKGLVNAMKLLFGRPVLLVALVVLAVSPLRLYASTPAAVLTSCKGSVTVVRSGGSAPAAFGLPLHDGDEVKTAPGAEAEIMFSAGNWVQIGPNSSMKIKGHPGDKPDVAADKAKSGNFEVVQNFLKLKSSEGTSAISGLRSGEKPARLEPVAPCQTRIRVTRPEFRWRIDDLATELRLIVYGENKVVWQSDVVNVTTLTYPTGAPALRPGVSYSWTLETTDPLVTPPLRTPASFFELIAPADAQTLDTDLSALDANKPGPVTYHLMRASLFFEHGLVDDAIAETESAVASDPDNGSLHTILGRLYAEAGRTRDAITELNQGQK